MSVDRSITIDVLVEKKGIVDCLKLLFSNDWVLSDKSGKITYLPVGNTDSANPIVTTDTEIFYKAVKEKEKNKELCLVHIWDNHYEEAHILFIYPEKENERYNHFKLLFSLGASKRLKGSQRQSDFSYYLEKIIPILEINNFLFESITCKDLG